VEEDVKKAQSSVSEKKKQQILVPHDFSDACQCAVSYGLMLAQVFRCELTLIHIMPKVPASESDKANETEGAMRTRLAQISGRLQSENGIPVNAYIFRGKVQEIVSSIIERINAIIVVAGLNTVNRKGSDYFSPSNLVGDYRSLRIPLLVVQNKMPEASVFKHIMLPIDFQKESKEKASWAGYFSKLYQSFITVTHTEYRDGFLAVQLRNNLMLVKKLFNTLGTLYEFHKADKVRNGIDRYTISYAKIKGAGMIIITTTKDWGFDDYLMGPIEKKIITNEDQLPVMMINPRDDLFVPCI
jgi:hypothetical protein